MWPLWAPSGLVPRRTQIVLNFVPVHRASASTHVVRSDLDVKIRRESKEQLKLAEPARRKKLVQGIIIKKNNFVALESSGS